MDDNMDMFGPVSVMDSLSLQEMIERDIRSDFSDMCRGELIRPDQGPDFVDFGNGGPVAVSNDSFDDLDAMDCVVEPGNFAVWLPCDTIGGESNSNDCGGVTSSFAAETILVNPHTGLPIGMDHRVTVNGFSSLLSPANGNNLNRHDGVGNSENFINNSSGPDDDPDGDEIDSRRRRAPTIKDVDEDEDDEDASAVLNNKSVINGIVKHGSNNIKQQRWTGNHVTGRKDVEKTYPKPTYSYSCLIAMALKNSSEGSLPVSEIYNFMIENFPYFRTAPHGWKNSVRHNLSLNKCFEKIEKPAGNGTHKKGCLWTMNPEKIEKMDEEMQKWSRKDPGAIRRSMACPENFELIEKGFLQQASSSPAQTQNGTPAPIKIKSEPPPKIEDEAENEYTLDSPLPEINFENDDMWNSIEDELSQAGTPLGLTVSTSVISGNDISTQPNLYNHVMAIQNNNHLNVTRTGGSNGTCLNGRTVQVSYLK